MIDGIKDMLRPFYRKYKYAKYRVKKFLNAPANEKRFKKSYEYIKSLENIHCGERCFIIGNGPSLKASDLDKIKNEVSFGANRIYKIFDKTDWRPTYYCSQDYKLIKHIKNDIPKMIHGIKLIFLNDYLVNPDIEGAYYAKLIFVEDKKPGFSNDISKFVYNSSTVTYTAIQTAIYMGFKEIILLGVDNNYSITRNSDGTIVRQNVSNYFASDDKQADKIMGSMPRVDNCTLAYEVAKEYADAHGIKIYNATRGGKLEVFERVDFDSLFDKESKK